MQGPKERWVRLPTQSPTEPKQPFPAKAGWLYRIGKTTRPAFARQALLQTALGSRKARETRQRTPSTQGLEGIFRAWSCAEDGSGSDPWTDVGHQVSVDPVDDPDVHVRDLEEGGDLRIPGTTVDPDHVRHAPSPIRVSDDHGHSRLDVQKNRIRLGCCNTARMVNRHPFQASTYVLAEEL